jgi:alpha-tubulin suppressor-like RCC1 family protein
MKANWNGGCTAVLFFLALGCGEASPENEETCSGGTALEGDGQSLTALAVGPASACGLANDGTLLCWGGSALQTPEPVEGVDSAVGVTIGSPQTCAIRPGGSVVCWSDYEPPTPVPDLCGATALAVSVGTRCAVVSDGRVLCWGGLNETVFGKAASESPVAVPGVTGATAVAAGASGYACALISDGSVMCWGGGPRGADRPGIQPAPVPEIEDAVALAGSGEAFPDMCALLADGGVTCWSRSAAPARVTSVENVISLAHGPAHDCVILADGSALCWGQNMDGQLGNGTQENSASPVVVEGLSGATSVAVNGVGSSLGESCALLEDGSARCWGSNGRGQLGNGTFTDSSTPVEVLFP